MALTKNPNHNKFIKPDGYRDIGWQLTRENSQELDNHYKLKHSSHEFDNSMLPKPRNRCYKNL